MAILICKLCGGHLIVDEDTELCECECCGTKQTIPTEEEQSPDWFDFTFGQPPATVVAPPAAKIQLLLPGGVAYEGDVFANLPHGQGKATYDNGDCYEGGWQRGKRHGKGVLTFAKGGQWVGEFRDNKPRNGSGIYHYNNGIYKGAFVDGLRHGKGEFCRNDGECYQGDWQQGQRCGQGKIVWAKGGAWSGEFYDDRPWNGSGIVHFADGSFCKVVTRDGEHSKQNNEER